VQWYKAIISGFGRLKQEDYKIEASLGYIADLFSGPQDFLPYTLPAKPTDYRGVHSWEQCAGPSGTN
jgi:hypothetical protein